MKQIFDEYGFIPGYIAIIIFSISWLSIPFYFKQCEKLVALIDQVERYGKIVKADLFLFDFSYIFRWKWTFRRLPDETKYPNLLRFKPIREQIDTIKLMRRLYVKVFFILLILVPLLVIGIRLS